MAKAKSEEMGQEDDGPGGTSAQSEEEILSKLLFDEGEFLVRLQDTTERAMKFFRIEPRTGRVVLSDDSKRGKTRDQIRLILAGRFFAWKLRLVDSDKMNYRQLAVELNRSPGSISPELTALVREGDLVRDEAGLVSMPFHRIDGTLRELEQPGRFQGTEGETAVEPVRRNGSRRIPRQRSDPIVQEMLEKTMDLSEYAWVRDLKKALDKGLAALLIAKEHYGVAEMTCPQMVTFLTRTFPTKVTRGAINMAFLEVRSQYVAAATRGKEISYTLLPLGREYIGRIAQELASRSVELESTSPTQAKFDEDQA